MMNIRDLGMRIRGRWSNEAGAHAGFTGRELTGMCHEAFGEARDVSESYYARLYDSKKWVVKQVCRPAFRNLVLPCVYVFGTKPDRA